MKRSTFFLLLVVCIIALTISVVCANSLGEDQPITDDGLWSYLKKDNGVTLTEYYGTATDVYVPGKVYADNEEYTVLALGQELFADNDKLNSVTLADNITEIGERAFYDADNLVCIVTGKGLSSIGSEVAYGCDRFNSIILYDTVESIGMNAFVECPQLTIWCNEGTTGHTYAIENNIAYSLLNTGATPETYVIDGVTYYILDGEATAIAFDQSSTEVTICPTVNGYPVTQLRETFRNSTELASVVIPDTVKTIGEETFSGCTALTEVLMQDSVTQIGNKAFYQCKSLTEIRLSASLEKIGSSIFEECFLLESLKIPEGIKEIPFYAFRRCLNLKEVFLPDSLITISTEVFSYTAIEEIVIPENVSRIENEAFYYATELRTLTVNAKNVLIRYDAFECCKALETVYFNGNVNLESRVFVDTNNFKTLIIKGNVYCGYEYGSPIPGHNLETVIIEEGVEYVTPTMTTPYLPYVEIPRSITSGLSADSYRHALWVVYENSYAYTVAKNSNGLIRYVVRDAEDFGGIFYVDRVYYYIQDGQAVAFSSNRDITSAIVPGEVNGFPVTTLNRTFCNRSNLESLSLPDGLRSISSQTFAGCEVLKEAYIPQTVEEIPTGLFANCTALTKAALPAGLASIPRSTFYGCSSLQLVALPEYYTEIGEFAFYKCSALTQVLLPDTLGSIGEQAFYGCKGLQRICLPEGIHTLGEGVFYDCSNLVEIELACSLDTIPKQAFYQCGALQTITLPEGILGIADEAFAYCNALNIEKLPESLQFIGEYAFTHCSKLDIEQFPASLQSIGAYGFSNCTSLSQIILPDTLTSLGEHVFDSCSAVVKVKIGNGLKEIPTHAFTNCMDMRELDLGTNLETIGRYAFNTCTSLTEVTLPSSLKTLVELAFFNCSSLKKITVPGSVSVIGEFAFRNCASLEKATICDGVTTIAPYTFQDCSTLSAVYLPGSVTSISATSIPAQAMLFVTENSYSKTFAEENNYLYLIWDGQIPPEYYAKDGVYYILEDDCYVAVLSDKDLVSTSISQEINGYPVTEIRGAFQNCSALQQISLPEGLLLISKHAFASCSALTQITIPSTVTSIGNYAFTNCAALQEIILPDATTVLGTGIFKNCTSLKKAYIPDSINTIPYETFSGCTALATVEGCKNVTVIDSCGFYQCTALSNFQIPTGLTTLNSSAFYKCDGLVEVTLPSTLQTIGEKAFQNCYNLKKVVFSEGIPLVSSRMFDSCYFLQTVILGDGIQKVDSYAFSNCYRMTTCELPATLTSLRTYAFNNCDALKSVVIPGSVRNIGTYTFYDCDNLISVTVEKDVPYISQSMFYGCEKLKSVTLNDGLVSIEQDAFRNCNVLSTIEFPQTLQKIGQYAFSYCLALKKVVIPSSVTHIYLGAFWYAPLSELTIYGNSTSGTQIYNICTRAKAVQLIGGKITLQETALSGAGITSFKIIDSRVTAGNASFIENPFTEVYVDGTIVSLGEQAFANCSNLKHIVLTEGTTTIGANAFNGCNLLTALVPSTVTSMKKNSFDNNTILLVYENSYAHKFAKENNLLYFVVYDIDNPCIANGTSISGIVKYTDGTPAASATVEILYSDGRRKELGKTDTNGIYNFTYAEVGDYIIRAIDAEENTSATRVSVKRMNVFDVFLSGETELVLKRGYCVSGTVSESANVTLTDEDGNAIMCQQTAEGNKFTFENVPNGTYILRADSENGSISQQITVFDSDLQNILLTVPANAVTIWGHTIVQNRDGTQANRTWVQVTAYNEEGSVVAQCYSDADGKYTFKNLSAGKYSIVAETTEMRPVKEGAYDRCYTLTGYAYVPAGVENTYRADIILYEENDDLTKLSGKVTAHGQTQTSTVILQNVFHHEVASYTTKNNGKYNFANVPDGLYFITAVTESKGMGFTVVVVKNAKVYGQTDITVYKDDKITQRERLFYEEVPMFNNKEEVEPYRIRIAEEKSFYDGLSQKEKKQLGQDYVTRLNQYMEWLAEVEYIAETGVAIEQVGLVVSGDEIKSEDQITFTVNIEKKNGYIPSADGVKTEEDYLYHCMVDAADGEELKQHYEITLSKTVDGQEQQITNVRKDTDTTGKLLVVLQIPQEHQGYNYYSILHEHCGEVVRLADLDDNPETITIEVDAFSTFVLTATNVEKITCDHTVIQNGICVDCDNTIAVVVLDSEGNVIDNFTSLTDALSAAAEGQTLSLQENIVEKDVVLHGGVNLDLNGYTLTADSVLTYSSSAIIDTSEDVSGLLKIKEDGNMISKDNAQLAVYDNEAGGYRFFAIDVQPCAVTGNNKYWFKIKAEKFASLYTLIQADANVQIQVKMTWDSQTEGIYATADLTFTKTWADKYNANADIYITVSIAETEGVENFKLIPMITSGGVEISGDEM